MAEDSPGSLDTLVLPLGALATVVAVLALGLWPAWRAARALRTDERAANGAPLGGGGQLVAWVRPRRR